MNLKERIVINYFGGDCRKRSLLGILFLNILSIRCLFNILIEILRMILNKILYSLGEGFGWVYKLGVISIKMWYNGRILY